MIIMCKLFWMKEYKSQKLEVGQDARDAWARALLKSADKHNDERLRGLANEISSEGKETKSRGMNIKIHYTFGKYWCYYCTNRYLVCGNDLP